MIGIKNISRNRRTHRSDCANLSGQVLRQCEGKKSSIGDAGGKDSPLIYLILALELLKKKADKSHIIE